MNIGLLTRSIGRVLACIGINTYRNFIPAFIFLILVKWGECQNIWCCEKIRTLSETSPSITHNWYVFGIIAVLAIGEFIANYQEDLREFYENSKAATLIKEIMTVLTVMAILDAKEAAVIKETLAVTPVQAGFSLYGIFTYFVALFSALAERLIDEMHGVVVNFVRSIDPENTFKLNTLLSMLEDTVSMSLLVIVIVAPILIPLLFACIVLGGMLCKWQIARIERKRRHNCPVCGTNIPNHAEICHQCKSPQEVIQAVGPFGLPDKKRTIADEFGNIHKRKLLISHRCPVCAERLESDFQCEYCHEDIWSHGIGIKDYVNIIDRRAIGFCIFFAITAIVQFVGFSTIVVPIVVACINLVALVFFRHKVLIPIKIYQKMSSRVIGRFIRCFFKVIKLLICLVGLFCPVLFMISYSVEYLFYRRQLIRS